MLFRGYLYMGLTILLAIFSLVSGGASLMFSLEGYSVIWEWEFLWNSGTSFEFVLFFDWASCLFFSFVSLISSSVMFYSGSYMSGEKDMDRFIILVSSFVGSMFFLVFSLNMVSILLGWDGLGLTSYLLVVYYQNEKSNSAGMITALSNRIGDVAILLSIALMVEFGSWGFMFWAEWGVLSQSMSALLVIAAMTKSAQMPFSAWLPAAMAAPTPVSALVHSSTLVTAGVYLVFRLSPGLSSEVMSCLAVVGGLTTLMASLSANLETDLKKVIALSTLSLLGLMMFSLGLGYSTLAFFHLLTHATFKALLFMCAGKIIHEMGGTQDGRFMGGGLWGLPYSAMCMNISNMALCGVPFMAGFYSKDGVVEASLMCDMSALAVILLSLNVGLSATYSIRVVIMSMIAPSSQTPLSGVSDEDFKMLWSKVGLTALAVSSGAMLSWVMFSNPDMTCLPLMLKVLALLGTVSGGVLGFVLYALSKKSEYLMKSLSVVSFFMCMWFLPWLSGMGVSSAGLNKFKLFKVMDLGWWEIVGGYGVYWSLSSSAKGLLSIQSNSIKVFLTGFGFSVLMILSVWYLKKFKEYNIEAIKEDKSLKYPGIELFLSPHLNVFFKLLEL